jgi:hypothetical protein
LILTGRAKKNWKSADLILAALYRLLFWETEAGNQCYVLANDEDQAADDLELIASIRRSQFRLIDNNPLRKRKARFASTIARARALREACAATITGRKQPCRDSIAWSRLWEAHLRH